MFESVSQSVSQSCVHLQPYFIIIATFTVIFQEFNLWNKALLRILVYNWVRILQKTDLDPTIQNIREKEKNRSGSDHKKPGIDMSKR